MNPPILIRRPRDAIYQGLKSSLKGNMGKIDAGELNETAFTLPAKKADRQLTVFARTVACA